jgi:short-subunit dehydrogenase involved in D-alanine esterification of teichoic acids
MGGNKMKLTGKTVVITGGASGIGFALAKKLMQMNNEVLIVGRNPDKLAAARIEIPQIITLQYDLGLDKDRLALATQLKREYPRLSVLINNAGIQHLYRFDLEPPPLELIQEEIETNLIAPVRLSSLLIDLLRQSSESAIINISSGLAIAPKGSAPIYCASKAALSSFTRALRYQLEQTSIQVYDVQAPLVDTNMTKGRGRGKISSDAFAAAFISGVHKKTFSMRIGKVKVLYALHRLIPSLAYRIMKRG